MRRTLTERELYRRRPVWSAFSALFLDTELDDADLQNIAATLRESGYTLFQLEHILKVEVAPIVGGNVLSVAGIWDGFDPEWLEEKILKLRGSGTLLGRLSCQVIRAEWARVKTLYMPSHLSLDNTLRLR